MGAAVREQGQQVRLIIPAQFIKHYRKSNKNDFLDAEAIAEAVIKENMRFVQIKTRSSWMCKPCIGFAIDWCNGARHSSPRSGESCWNAASPLRPNRSISARTCLPSCRRGRCGAELECAPALAAEAHVTGVEAGRARHQSDDGGDRAHQPGE